MNVERQVYNELCVEDMGSVGRLCSASRSRHVAGENDVSDHVTLRERKA